MNIVLEKLTGSKISSHHTLNCGNHFLKLLFKVEQIILFKTIHLSIDFRLFLRLGKIISYDRTKIVDNL